MYEAVRRSSFLLGCIACYSTARFNLTGAAAIAYTYTPATLPVAAAAAAAEQS